MSLRHHANVRRRTQTRRRARAGCDRLLELRSSRANPMLRSRRSGSEGAGMSHAVTGPLTGRTDEDRSPAAWRAPVLDLARHPGESRPVDSDPRQPEGRRSSDAPAARADRLYAAGWRHNLPQPLTSFIGREREIAEARRLLEHDSAADTHRDGRGRQDAARPRGRRRPARRRLSDGTASGSWSWRRWPIRRWSPRPWPPCWACARRRSAR